MPEPQKHLHNTQLVSTRNRTQASHTLVRLATPRPIAHFPRRVSDDDGDDVMFKFNINISITYLCLCINILSAQTFEKLIVMSLYVVEAWMAQLLESLSLARGIPGSIPDQGVTTL